MTPKDPEFLGRKSRARAIAGNQPVPVSGEVPAGFAWSPGPERDPGTRARASPADPGDFGGEGAIYGRVSDLLEKGRLHEAENLLARGLEIYPESVDLLKELGVLYHLQGRFGKAARTFTRVMNITGEGKQSFSWRIASLFHKALEEFHGPDPGLSLSSFDEILTLDPSEREALAGKIAALRVLGRLEEAERCLERGLALSPPGPSILYQEGWLLMDRDSPDLAIAAFEEAARADPSWLDPVVAGALALERTGKSDEGERLLRDPARTGRGIPGLPASLGWFLINIHEPGKAREIFQGLAGKEDDPAGFHGLAAALMALGQIEKAEDIMGRLVLAFPRDPLLQVNHGMVLARKGGGRELADAAIAAKRALGLDPRFAPAHSCLGIVAFREGRPEAAEAHFSEAAWLSDPAGPRNLGLLACAGGRWEEAEPLLVRAARLDPSDARAWAGLGAIALHGGRTGEAILHLKRASSIDPLDNGPARGLAIALARSGDLAGAEEVIRRALGLAPGPDRWILLLNLAEVLVRKGGAGGTFVLDEEAGQVLGEAAALRSDHPGISFLRGVVEGRLGHPKEAIDLLASATEDEMYRIPAHENIRRLRERAMSGKGPITRLSFSRSALALLCLLQLAALWLVFGARFISEAAFVLLLAILSGLFALAILMPPRAGEERKEPPLELIVPEAEFVPSPEPEMVSPFIRLRTALRP